MLNRKNDKGYTLVEMLIAIVIGFVLVAAATTTYISQNRSYVAQESVSEINTQSKIAHDLIADAIRSAGYGIPEDMNLDPVNTFTTIVTPVEGGVGASDAINIVGGFRRIGTLWPNVAGAIGCPAVVPLDTTTITIIYSGAPVINAAADRSFLSIDGVQFVQVTGCTMDSGNCQGVGITFDRPLVQDFPLIDTDGDGFCDTGRPVYLVEDTRFCVDANSILRRIRRNGAIPGCAGIVTADDDVIAENIEDLQFAYAIDTDNDGVINIGGILLDDGDFVNGSDAGIAADPSIIGAVRINVLARTDRADPDYSGLGNPPALIENRVHAVTNDDFRRRWWQTLVTMRN